jgi:hypothetical protein
MPDSDSLLAARSLGESPPAVKTFCGKCVLPIPVHKRSQLLIRSHNETLAAITRDYGQHCSLNKWIQIARSSSRNAVNCSSAGTTNRFPSRCASAMQIVRPSESMAEIQPKLHPALLRLSAMISQHFTNTRTFDCGNPAHPSPSSTTSSRRTVAGA